MTDVEIQPWLHEFDSWEDWNAALEDHFGIKAPFSVCQIPHEKKEAFVECARSAMPADNIITFDMIEADTDTGELYVKVPLRHTVVSLLSCI